MLSKLLIAGFLVAVTVVIHAVGLTGLIRLLLRSHSRPPTRYWPITWLLVRVAWSLVLIHLAEISIWAIFYLRQGCLPDAESAFYFSGATYTTLGYGDLVLPVSWRLFGPVEGLTGILMCGLSAGLFFAIVSRINASRMQSKFWIHESTAHGKDS